MSSDVKNTTIEDNTTNPIAAEAGPPDTTRHGLPWLGVSSCLLGHKVRYDGDHQYQPLINDYFADRFQLRHFCPEMAIGLGVPRPKIQLVQHEGDIICVDQHSETINYTAPLAACCNSEQYWLTQICGYILKTKSPSCGVTKVKTRYPDAMRPTGQGIFARELRHRYPHLPLIEEDQLSDEIQRHAFIQQALNYHQQHGL